MSAADCANSKHPSTLRMREGVILCIREEHTDQKYLATCSRRDKAGSSVKNWQHLRDLHLLESVPADPYSTPWHI